MNKQDQLIVLRDNAKAELMKIKDIDGGLSHLSKVLSIQTWIRAEKMDAELQVMINEQKLRTERIIGELIKQGQEAGEIASQKNFRGNQYEDTATQEVSKPKSLPEIGLTHKQSSNFKRIAGIPEPDFEAWISEKKENVDSAVKELSTTSAVNFSKKLNKKDVKNTTTDHKVTSDLITRLAREKELLQVAKDINNNYNKKERAFIKDRIKA